MRITSRKKKQEVEKEGKDEEEGKENEEERTEKEKSRTWMRGIRRMRRRSINQRGARKKDEDMAKHCKELSKQQFSCSL